jgi:hypothetical protein
MSVALGAFLFGKLVLVSAMLVIFALSLFDERIPSEIAATLPLDREPVGDPIDADYRRLPL